MTGKVIFKGPNSYARGIIIEVCNFHSTNEVAMYCWMDYDSFLHAQYIESSTVAIFKIKYHVPIQELSSKSIVE